MVSFLLIWQINISIEADLVYRYSVKLLAEVKQAKIWKVLLIQEEEKKQEGEETEALKLCRWGSSGTRLCAVGDLSDRECEYIYFITFSPHMGVNDVRESNTGMISPEQSEGVRAGVRARLAASSRVWESKRESCDWCRNGERSYSSR